MSMNIDDAYDSSSGDDGRARIFGGRHARVRPALISGTQPASRPRRRSWLTSSCLPTKMMRVRTTDNPKAIAALIAAAMFLWVFSGTVTILPATQMCEEVLCRIHYGSELDGVDLGSDEGREMCKHEDVQTNMAYILGFAMVLTSIIGGLVALPFGVLADRARRPVYFLAAFGQFLNISWGLIAFRFWESLPIALLLLGPLFQLLGGGIAVAIPILFSIISDTQPVETKAISYFYISVAAQSASLLGPPFAALLMRWWSPWVPMCLVPLITAAAGLVMVFIPETGTNQISLDSDGQDLVALDVRSLAWWRAWKSQIGQRLRESTSSVSTSKKRPVMLLLVSFATLPTMAIGLIGPTFAQYVSVRYGKTIEQVGYVLAVKGIVSIVVMGVILPGVSTFLVSPKSPIRLSGFRKDLYLARVSFVMMAIGFFMIAGSTFGSLTTGLIVETIGGGVGPLCRSLITEFVDPGQTSSLFAFISIVETLGSLPAGPLFAWTFATGMKAKGFWYGLPFYFLALLALVGLGALCLIRRNENKDDYRPLWAEDGPTVDGANGEYTEDNPL